MSVQEEIQSIQTRGAREAFHGTVETTVKDAACRQIIEQSMDCIKFLDLEGNVIFMSQRGSEAIGISDSSICQGVNWATLWHGAKEKSDVLRALEKARNGHMSKFEGYCATMNGEPKWWESIICPVFNQDREITGLLAISRDVSIIHRMEEERKKILEILHRERTKIARIIDNFPSGLLIAEAPDGKICMGNKKVEEIMCHPIYNSLSIQEYTQWQGWHLNGQKIQPEEWPLSRAIKGEVSKIDLKYQCGDGTSKYLRVYGAPILDENSHVTGGVVTLNDITKQKELEKQKEAFLSLATHELKTPLTALQGSVQLAQKHLYKIEQTRDITQEEKKRKIANIQRLLTRCMQQVRLQNRLINDIFYMSRLQTEKLELHRQPCDLASIIEEAVADQQTANPKRVIEFIKYEHEQLIGNVDRDRIGQVINNYLTNALKYSPDDRPVSVGITTKGSNAYIWVKDLGPGLSETAQEHIWQRFYQEPEITVQGTGSTGIGLGLGLYICEQLINRHQGQIGVESKQGEGSTFWFSLPLHTEEI